ncbi:zinc finger CCCH domain-containing protein 18-like [Rutidosis leptorrhynchoides]|uniref:zinc finger CCCH domain-containing protein 18-like n=1 Tax=Rutidosis leptorrhynchoides TaxID=125765 RepID=UPI003A990DEB
MDFSESTKIVYDRIQKLEPEKVSKIIGYLMLQDHGEKEMIRLAFGPDNLIQSLINEAKFHFNSTVSIPIPPSGPTKFTPLTVYPASFPDNYHFQNQLQFLSLDDHMDPANGSNFVNSYCYSEPTSSPRIKICHYFMKGGCRHGNSCKYSHGNEIFSPVGFIEDDNVFSLWSLRKLEMELTQLLKSRRGLPVSIASLPMLYYQMFGKTLQAEGYLTESQRHGKAGYSLTKLLARLKRITLIDRPHGQHSVILTDDVTKYMDYNGDKYEQGGIVAGSKQIYLTFPAESTFTEQDVSNYFKKFGPVNDVRIPCQQKRMFGFVTFAFGETVKEILNKGNPHFVCGARILVKPYREKSREDKKVVDKFRYNMYNGANSLDAESVSRICDNLTSLELSSRPKNQLCFGYSLEELRISEEQFGQLFDVFNNGQDNDERVRMIDTIYHDQENNQGPNLPDSPFASVLGAGISTAT